MYLGGSVEHWLRNAAIDALSYGELLTSEGRTILSTISLSHIVFDCILYMEKTKIQVVFALFP